MAIIHLTDTIPQAAAKLAEGNPGAATVLINLINEAEKIDPDDFMGGIGSMLNLDSYGIYGTDIWVFYSDICNKDLARVVAVLRACELGMFSSKVLAEACNKQDHSGVAMVPVEELYLKVKERLPRFHTNKDEEK